MTEIITAGPISRRKALALFGLVTAALAAGSVVAAPEAEAQTVGMTVRSDAEAATTGGRRGAPAAPRGVKNGASNSRPDAPARIRTEDLFGFAGAALVQAAIAAAL